MSKSESVQHYIEILEAYRMGEIILVKDLNHFGGWRPKKSGTPWLFGVESYAVKDRVVVAVDPASPGGDKATVVVGIRNTDGSIEIKEYVEV